MLPWERLIYIDLIKQHIKEEQDRAKDQANAKKDLMRAQNILGKMNGRNKAGR